MPWLSQRLLLGCHIPDLLPMPAGPAANRDLPDGCPGAGGAAGQSAVGVVAGLGRQPDCRAGGGCRFEQQLNTVMLVEQPVT